MLSEGGGVPGGQGCIPPALRVRRAAVGTRRRRSCVGTAGSAVSGVAGVRLHGCEPGGWLRPEEARAIWLGGRRDRCSTKEGFPSSSRLQHALVPRYGRRRTVVTHPITGADQLIRWAKFTMKPSGPRTDAMLQMPSY
jgi:hypothetical protein